MHIIRALFQKIRALFSVLKKWQGRAPPPPPPPPPPPSSYALDEEEENCKPEAYL